MNKQKIISSTPDFWGNAMIVLLNNIESVDDIFSQLDQKLNLPEYFGFNWNALYDCLCDLHWVMAKDLLIIHTGIFKLPGADLEAYTQLANDVADSWLNDDHHRISFIFLNEQNQ
jgi:hypothetical protein